MATFGELVFSVLDLLKEKSDDAFYTEEHVIFLLSKMRSLLLERKYRNSRNSTFQQMSEENLQEVCLHLELAEQLPLGCGGNWLRSIEEVPNTLSIADPKIYLTGDLIQSVVTYIPPQRMPYVGHNKWLRNIVYVSRSKDGHVYFNSVNPQMLYLKEAKMEAAFSDPEEAATLSCDPNQNACDILSVEFPLESALIPSCIEMVLQELIGSRYAPEDLQNNAKDDLGAMGVTQQKAQKPAESSRRDGEGA